MAGIRTRAMSRTTAARAADIAAQLQNECSILLKLYVSSYSPLPVIFQQVTVKVCFGGGRRKLSKSLLLCVCGDI